MKKFVFIIAVFVLTAAVMTACGCRNSQPMNTTAPTTMPTTAPTTMPTSAPTERPAPPATTQETIEDGNGPLPTNATAGADGDTSTATEDNTMEGRSRSIPRTNEK